MTDKPDQVLVDITISAPVDEVWKALRDPDQIANWFGWHSTTLKDEIAYIFLDHATADDAGRTLRFAEWEGISHRLEVTPAREGARVRLVISGAAEIDWTGIYEDMREGWVTFFQQLRFWLDRHPSIRRRTLYLSGVSNVDQDLRLILGLDDLLTLAPGSRYALATPVEKMSGGVWHKTHYQIGLTVREWGDGLLVVTHKGVTEDGHSVLGSLILATYGLSPFAFSDIEMRWEAWWTATHLPAA